MIRAKQAHILELNQMKLQFFANISHELRTPLTLIISPLENIIASDKWNIEIKDQLASIYRNATRLFRLVNEIMDFTKIEDSKLTVSVQSGDIVKFIKEISSSFKDEAARREIQYQFTATPSQIEAWFDRDKIEKIISNLLSNAFKFTQDHGSISLVIEKMTVENIKDSVKPIPSPKELVQISVIDNGKGIPAKDLDKIFERFYQSKDENYIHSTGTGIGLALTKSLVELHHGTISVSSEKGKETRFTVSLPLGNTHFKQDEIMLKPIDGGSKPFTFSNQPLQKDNERNKPGKTLPTILLVEDNFELREYILSELSRQYNVLEANDGVSGYTLATEHAPDLIISDIIMPNLTGIELCKQLKGNILTSHIPIILLTAKTTLEDQITGIETGADAYITKPFNVRYLEVTVKNLIETRHKLFQRFSQEVYILPKEISDNPIDQDFLENIITYIENNITSSELSVENLSAHLLMSSGHTWRKIKSLTGQSTNEFIRTIRLKKSIKLIEEKKYNVAEIAYKVGFTSPAYFTKCFRKQYGKSPSEYTSNSEKKGNEI
jgi:DNA-binding response OmpR family regulator/nitrogen-specific signal transduction histidine kinase